MLWHFTSNAGSRYHWRAKEGHDDDGEGRWECLIEDQARLLVDLWKVFDDDDVDQY